MEQMPILEKHKLTWGLLFVGFCCVFGFLAMNTILLTHYTNSRHFANFVAVLQTLLMCLISSSFFIVFGSIAFVWARRRLKRTVNKEGLVCKSILPAVCLTPVLGVVGMAMLIMTPFVYGHVRQFVAGPHVVQAADSPDGAYQAYVIDKPSFDGPNHHLYVKDTATGQSVFVANLPEDVDSIQQIQWSSFNDVVVFRTWFKLIAYSPPAGKIEEVVLGGERHYRDNGTFWVDYKNVKKPWDLQFPKPGVFSYRFEGLDEVHTLAMK